jgi:N-acetylneuraminate synthase/pseudaminic acid synthase
MNANSVFIIAEMSANHCGDIDLAKRIISAAKTCGADSIKLQTYTADTMTIDCKTDAFKIKGGTLWDDKYLYDLYKEAYTPWKWQQELKSHADEIGIELFSTPFDASAVDFLEGLGVQKYKIASFEANDIPLVRYTASKKKPIIISTGVISLEEMYAVVEACHSVGNRDVTLLKCTSAYPAKLEDMNLRTIRDLLDRFGPMGVKIGISDHSMEIEPVVAAVALGATVIEKHFTIDRAMGGADAGFSLNVQEFSAMIQAVRRTESVLGLVDYSIPEKNRAFARSLFVVKDVKRGEALTSDNIRSIRPGCGLAPKYYDQVIGSLATQDLKRGKPLELSDVVLIDEKVIK